MQPLDDAATPDMDRKRVASATAVCVWVVVIILIDFAHERALISISHNRESGVESRERAEPLECAVYPRG